MILYANGDSHTAGAEINNNYCFADDDPKIQNDKGPHPDNIKDSFGYLLAKKLNYTFVTDAVSGCSNYRILKTTKEFIKNNYNNNFFLLIGWTSFDRVTVTIKEIEYHFSPGYMTDDPDVKKEFKKYILSIDKNEEARLSNYWHDEIYKFHCELKDNNIKHLFFNTTSFFNNSYIHNDFENLVQHDWNNQYIGAYKKQDTYCHWLGEQGYVRNSYYHYRADGHAAWADRLYNWLTSYQLL